MCLPFAPHCLRVRYGCSGRMILHLSHDVPDGCADKCTYSIDVTAMTMIKVMVKMMVMIMVMMMVMMMMMTMAMILMKVRRRM